MGAIEYVLIMAGGSLALVLIMIVAAITRQKVIADRNGFSIGGPGGEERRKSPHATCKHSKDIIFLLQEMDRVNQIIFYEKHIGTVKDQMNYAEQKITEITFLCSKHFLKLLKEIQGSKDGISSSEQYRFYMHCLKDLQHEEIILMRHTIRENHFSEKTEDEFNTYEEAKGKQFLNRGSEILNGLYCIHKEGWPTREQIYDHNQLISNDLLSMVKDVLRQSRKIAIEKEAYVRGLQEGLKQQIKELFT